VRVRLTSTSSPGPTGHSGNGEVEDYLITVSPASITVGNMVWNDLDQDGVLDAGEPGMDGITVQLRQGANLIATTTTAGGGFYSFSAPAGTGYFIRLPTVPAATPFASGPLNRPDNGVDGRSRARQPGGVGTLVESHTFNLAANTEPGTAGGTNTENTIDIALRAVPNPVSLLEYLFGSTSPVTPINPSVKDPCITNTAQLQPTSTNLTWNNSGAENGPLRPGTSHRWIQNTPATYNSALEATRTNLTPTDRTIHTTFTFANGTNGTLGNILGDFCPDSTNPTQNIRFYLTWQDGAVFHTAWTNTAILFADSWTTVNLPFVNGATLPTGSGLSGRTFLLEAFLWGNTGTAGISLDNIILEGTCSIATTDFGDFSGFASASSTVVPSIRIGATTDTEASATTNSTATGDDITGIDDEDGVTLPPNFIPGVASSLVVNVTNTSGASAFLNVWIDYNRNGSFDAGEQIATNTTIAHGTTNSNRTINFTPPAGASPGTAGVRVRLTSTSSPGPTGHSGNGEVEDYVVTIVTAPNLDFGDLPDTVAGTSPGNYQTTLADNGPRHNIVAGLSLGASVDGEPDAFQSSSANGDDINGIDDEDAFVSLPSFVAGKTSTVAVRYINTTASAARISVWVDFNNNGSFADANEHVVVDRIAAVGGVVAQCQIPVPATAVTGVPLGMRVRLSHTAGLSSVGAATSGEVEDYVVNICPNILITPNFLPNGLVSTPYSQSLTATGGVPAYKWSLQNGTLPSGLSFTNGVLSGTPTLAGTWTFAVMAEDSSASAGSNSPQTDLVNNGNFNDTEGEWKAPTGWGTFTDSNGNFNQGTIQSEIWDQVGGGPGSFASFRTPMASPAGGSFVGTYYDGPSTSIVRHRFQVTTAGNYTMGMWVANSGLYDTSSSTWFATGPNYFNIHFFSEVNSSRDRHFVTPSLSRPAALGAGDPGPLYNPGWTYLTYDVDLQPGFYWVEFQNYNNGGVLYPGVNFGEHSSALPSYLLIDGVSLRAKPNAENCTAVAGYTVTVNQPMDFGDFSGFASASSTVVPSIRIGATTDTEASATTNSTATGDDITGIDDEDGVTLPPNFIPGAASSLVVNVTNTSGASAFLNVWIDYNRNGSFDAGEQIATNTTIAHGTTNSNRTINFTPPLTASIGHAGVRVRLTSTSSPGPTGHSGNGEVEDHMAYIGDCQADVVFLLDQSGSIDGTEWANITSSVHGIIDRVLASNATNRIAVVNYAGDGFDINLKPQIWIENDFTSNATTAKAFQWRTTMWQAPGTLFGGDDAHGAVSLVGRALDGTADSLPGLVSPLKRLTPVPDRPLVVFLFTDAVRSAGSSYLVNATSPGVGTNEAFQEFTAFKTLRGATFVAVIVPVDATGTAPAAAISSAGGSHTGVIESYPADPDGPGSLPRRLTTSTNFALTPAQLDEIARNICDAADGSNPVSDFGDYSLFGSASSRVIPNLRIGATTDAEFAAVTNSTATGDDTHGSDDEDGVTGPATVVPGTTYTANVNVTNTTGSTAFLNAWIDFNGNGDLTDAGERIASNLTIASGTTNSNRTLTFTVPAGAALGPVGVRVRLTSVSTGMPTGPVANGEVEDNIVTISSPSVLSIGDLVWNDTNGNGLKDTAESGIAGATVRLYSTGADNALGGTGANADTQIGASFTTSASGAYSFTNLIPGNYFVRVTPPAGNWTQTLMGGMWADNNIDNNSDANRNLNYADSFVSSVIALSPGTESTTDGDDANGNATIDFGLRNCLVIDPYIDPLGGPVSNNVVGTTVSYTDNSISTTFGPRTTSIEALSSGSSIYAEVIEGMLGHNHSSGARSRMTIKYGNESTAPLNKNLAALGSAFEMGMVFKDTSGSNITWTAKVWSGTNTATSTGVLSNTGLWMMPFSSFGPIDWTDIDAIEISFLPTGLGDDNAYQALAVCGPPFSPSSDFGDHSDIASASSIVTPGLRIGATTDAEFAAVTNSTATGDDTHGSDDEDGVTGPATVVPGNTYTATVNVTNTTGSTAFLNAWIDFNGNGDLTDAGERIASNVTIASGTTNSNRTLTFTVPAGAALGPVGVRVRLTSVSTGMPTGPVANGEVEDYAITIEPPYTIGNLVFHDNNRNGRFDAGDTGVSGVTLQLYSRWDTSRSTLIQSTTTAADGSYAFTNLPMGDYYVHLPASNFLSGAPLFGRVSSPGAGGHAGAPDYYYSDGLDDNANENGQDSHAPAITGIDSWGITLFAGNAPTAATTETGFNAESDNAADGFGNLTIDFGFITPETLPCPQHLLVLCGTDKGLDSLAFDHGLIGYLVAKGYQVTPALPDWAGLRDPASGTLLTVALTDFDGVVASATAHNNFLDNRGNITVNLNALARPILMLDGLAARFLGIGTAATIGWWRGSAWVEDNTLSILPAGLPNGNVNLNNAPIGPAGPTGADKKVVFSRNPGPGAQVGLWDVDQPSANNGFLYALYNAGAPLDNGLTAPATRVFYGITENGAGLYSPQIDLAATATNHFTAAGKNLLDKSIELAFAGICLVNDFGDHAGIGSASSRVVPGLRIGAQVDIDATPISDLAATGDDSNGIDDEDGVTFPFRLTPGNNQAITVNVTNTTGATAFLNVWIDYNGNGVLTDAGERITANVTIANGTINSNRNVIFTVPASATPGSAALRVRLTSAATSSPTGLVANGEVEDYVVQIGSPTHDFGDAAGLPIASATVSPNLFMGNSMPDAEFSASLNPTATGDDLTGIDDEDGADLPPAISPGTEVAISVAVTNRTGSDAFLTAWIDFNNDGILTNTLLSSGGELLETARVIPSAPFEQTFDIVFTVPAGASIGSNRAVRFRLASTSAAPPAGEFGTGEVEDYTVNITPPTRDFGDAPSSYGVASHLIVPRRGLGVLVDAEIASLHSANANGDDNSGIDDEDGVFFDQALIPGREASVIISTSGSGYVNLWIDWNRDGDFADAGEQMLTNTRIPPIKPGLIPLQGSPVILTFTVPPTASLGASFARARFTTSLWTGGPTGAAPSGEVEDHAITIQPASSLGGRLWADTNQNGIRDGSEPGVPGISVLLLRENGQVEDFTISNATGDYQFTSIPAGNYRVELGLAPGQHSLSPADQGGDDALDSEFDPTTRLSSLITLTAAASNLRVDAAIRGVTDSLGRIIRMTHSVIQPITFADWNHDAVLPKFDPALGNLTAATPHLARLLRFHLFAENRAVSAGSLSFSGDTTFDLTFPDASVQQNIVDYNFSFTFPSFDGSYDYHNASGLTAWDLRRSHHWFYPTSAPLADFIATNPAQTVTLTTALQLNINSSSSGGNLQRRSDFKVGEIVSLTYTFDLPQDHGDFSGFASASSTVMPSLRLGALTDAEASATLNATATGDDITDLDDEDGVLVPANIIPGVASSMVVNVTNTSGASAFLNAWIDFNGDGLLNNSEERIATNVVIANGTSNANRTLNFTPPLSLTPGQVGVRVRLTSVSTSNATGYVGNGEVEDYTVNILPVLPPTQVQSYALLDNGLPISANPLTGSTSTLYPDIRWTDGSTQNVPMDVTLNAGGGVIFRSTWPMGDAQDPAYVTEFGNDQAIPFLYLGPSTGGTASATFTLQRPVLGADVILYDIDEGDLLSVVIKDEFGNEITDRSAWRIMTGDLTTWNNPPAAAPPVWDAATGTVTAATSVNENRSYIVISPNVAISEVIVTFGPTTGSGRHAYVALHGDYLGPRLDLGNLVWADNNNNGLRDLGEPGLANVSVELYRPGNDGLVNTADDILIGSPIQTAATGEYRFSNLLPGVYFVKAYPLFNYRRTGGSPATTDNNIDNNNDGSQPGGAGTPLFSPLITLLPNTESITDGDTDPNTNLTVDFGLAPALDFGDFDGFASAASTLSNQIYLGTNPPDDEIAAVTNSAATGDDLNGIDDEDGLVSQGVIRSDQSGTITVRVTNSSTAAAFLNGWVDWNRNGVLETTERVINNITIAANTATANQNRSFTVPAFTAAGTYPLRLRLSSTSNPGATTVSGFGEVEDHFITVSEPNRDYGDFSGFSIASSTVNSLLKIGPVAADAEIGSTRNFDATGDDITGVADEDGLVAQSPLHPGAAGSITVNVSNGTTGGRFLNAWIDWNNNGTLETTERIATGSTHPVASGLNNHNMVLSFTVPANTLIGQVGVRLRLSNVSTAPATGFSGSGEVEDHLIEVTCPVITVTPGTLPNAVVGQPYSHPQPFSASGMATGAYLLSASSVPVGMSFNASAGSLQNTPTTAGLYNVNVTATSTTHAACSGSITVPLRVCPVINIIPGTIPAIYLGQEVNTQLTATGGQAPYTWSIVAGSLPNGVTLSSDGLLAGLPTEDGSTSFTIGVTDAVGCQVSQAYTQAISSLTVGNLVFHDRNENGVAEAGEGLSGVSLQLFTAGSNPLLDTPVETTLTDANGHYYFDQLAIGDYFIFVRPEQFETGATLSGLDPLSEQRPGDDNAGDDTLPTLNPTSTGVRTRLFSIAPGVLPTAATGETGLAADYDDAYDSDADLTIDLGFIRGAGLGNLVFKDLNENGTADPGEGVAGVTLELYTPDQVPGFDTPRMTTTTAADGTYLFFPIRGGIYKIHVPASNFDQGKPLFETVSIAEGLAGDDDVGEDGINVADPTLTGITSRIVSVFPGTAPTGGSGETGFKADSDDHLDAAIDLTVDFGFQTPVGVGNLVFTDLNENGVFDEGEGVGGVRVELFRADQSLESVPIFSQTTRADGHFFFGSLGSGSYRLRIPGNQFQPGAGLAGLLPLPHSPAGDDDVGQNGLYTDEPEAFGVVTEPFTLANNAAPTNADTETGFRHTDDDYNDNNFDLTQDFGFTAPAADRVSVGNLVYEDSNGDGRYTQGEGVPGVVVRLFSSAVSDPELASPIAETQTDAEGIYRFRNLLEGDYFVHIPASQFSTGGPLKGRLSLAGHGEDNGVDDDADENGIDSATPTTTGIRSVAFNLAVGSEPTDLDSESGKSAVIDNQQDENGDMTIDFGFFRPMAIGNLVFFDANNNGRSDLGEGVEGVEVQLFTATSDPLWDSPLAVTLTDESGRYLFSGLNPGSYLVHLPASQFALGAPLHGTISLLGHGSGDDDTSEDGVDSAEPQWFGISSRQIDLIAGEAPVGSAENGLFGDSDSGEDQWVDLTIDFGFGSRTGVGNLVFIDINDDGRYDLETEAGAPGVTVELWTSDGEAPAATTSTDADGLYQFNVPPGTYFVRIPASEFQPNAALAYHRSSTSNYLSSPATAGDDDVGEDGMDGEDPRIAGVRTPDFVLAAGTMPTADTTETGFFNGSDDATDANVDLTVDLGFTPVALSVGNLVFRDLDNNGRFNGNDRGIPGLLLHLFRVGDNPATDNPIDSILTDSEGRYLLQTTVPGFYFVHIPAQNFASGSQLEGALSSPGFGSDNGIDDDANEDGIDSANPEVTGINSIAFELAHGAEPVGPSGDGATETGEFADSDDEYDYLTDLTIDFGFNGGVNGNLGAIGNMVFIDANNNGVFDAGEGVGNVDIHLYQAAYPPGNGTAIASTVTASNGTYLFGNLPSGEYIVYVEPSNFQLVRFKRRKFEVGPLAGRISVLGTATGDDNAGEKGLDVSSPGQTGVRTAAITLDLENAPLDEPGAFTAMNATYGDANTDLTADFGFRSPPPSPDAERTRNVLALGSADDSNPETAALEEASTSLAATYAQWAEQHQLGSADAPLDDADQDGLSNLLEYALGSDPLNGIQPTPALKLTVDASGQLIASFARPAAGLEDLRFQLQTAADFDGTWSPLATGVTTAIRSDGRQEIQQAAQPEAGIVSPFGLVRLQVILDSDGDGQAEASTLSPVSAWTQRTFPVGQQSLSMPLLRPAIFSGLISAASGHQINLALPAHTSIESLLAAAGPCYLEITQGALAGHRFEIDLAQSQGHQLTLDLADPANTASTLPAGLVGSRAAIRRHWTLGDLLPPAALTAGPNRESADGALFFDRLTNSYLPLWLKAGEAARWTDTQDSSAGHRRIPAGSGLLLHLRHSPHSFTWTGEVRDHAFRLAVLPGSQLIASGYPNAVSPADLGLLPASPLIAADQPSLADNLKLWLGDSQPGTSGYHSLFLKSAAQPQLPATWSDAQSAVDQDFTHSLLLPRSNALFFARQPTEPILLIQTSPLAP
jgi:hypothetical protein